MQSTVEAFSAGLNRGSRFVVRLPLLPDAPDEMAPAAPVQEAPRPRRILVVDDDVEGARVS